MEVILISIISGSLLISAAVFDLNWVMGSKIMELPVRIMGRTGARYLLGTSGALLLITGFLMAQGIIATPVAERGS